MDRNELEAYYKERISSDPEEKVRPYFPKDMTSIINASQELYFILRVLHESNILQRNELRLLDIGCGYGRLLGTFIHQMGIDPKNCFGTETISGWLNYCRKVLPKDVNLYNLLIQEAVKDSGFIEALNSGGGIDIVFLRGVFCRLSISERRDLVSLIDKVLKPNGIVIIITHNSYAPFARGLSLRSFIKSMLPGKILFLIEKRAKEKNEDAKMNIYHQHLMEIFNRRDYKIVYSFSFGLYTGLRMIKYLNSHPILINLIAKISLFHYWRLIAIKKIEGSD